MRHMRTREECNVLLSEISEKAFQNASKWYTEFPGGVDTASGLMEFQMTVGACFRNLCKQLGFQGEQTIGEVLRQLIDMVDWWHEIGSPGADEDTAELLDEQIRSGQLEDGCVALEAANENIVEIVGKVVDLKRYAKGSYIGCCPFHEEKTPSFVVNVALGSYHCFGCKDSGNAHTFMARISTRILRR